MKKTLLVFGIAAGLFLLIFGTYLNYRARDYFFMVYDLVIGIWTIGFSIFLLSSLT